MKEQNQESLGILRTRPVASEHQLEHILPSHQVKSSLYFPIYAQSTGKSNARALLAQIKGLSSSGPKSGGDHATAIYLSYACGRAVGPHVLENPLAGQGLQLRVPCPNRTQKQELELTLI